IGGLVSVRSIDAAEIVDGDQEEPAGGTKTHRLLERLLEDFRQEIAIALAGELCAAGEALEPAFALVALIDDVDRALRARGFAVGVGEPAPGILHPKPSLRRWIGPD